ncbi:MAG: DUF86 domain-containing protein [Alphaproteobacteria bacterium]|nr:DUF86 domain-containing protein [Alphaproteobacteria bacterium]
MKGRLGNAVYLQHIEDAAAKILRFMDGKTERDFLADELLQDGVVRNLEIIGEAAGKLTTELKAKHPDIAWTKIGGMRNRLAHEYFQTNFTLIYDTVRGFLPEFRARIASLRKATRD